VAFVLDHDSGEAQEDEDLDKEGTLGPGADVLDGSPSQWGAPGPDGAPVMQAVAPPAPAPPFDPVNCPCLRGPCRHLFVVKTHFDHGNSPDSLTEQPKYRKLMCAAQEGVHLEMSADAPVLECNRWDPMEPGEQREVEARRARYFVAHPGHDPAVQAEQLEDELDDADDPTYEDIDDGTANSGTDSGD
jgi:hypothetical protein